MSKWTKLELARHQVAISGSVQDSLTGQAIRGAEVKLEQAPAAFTRYLAMKAVQYRDRWKTIPNRPIWQVVALSSTFYLLRQANHETSLRYVTYTTRDGYFYFVDLPDGDYTLAISLPNVGSRYGTARIDNLSIKRNNERTIQRAAVEIKLPPTAVKGKITTQSTNPVKEGSLETTSISFAKVEVEGSNSVTLSDRDGNYLLTELEVWQQSVALPPKPIIRVSAQGYEPLAQGVSLTQGEVKNLDFQLVRQ